MADADNSVEILTILDLVIPKNGYIYIYVANESPTDVYFDNLQIIHKKSNVLELNDYYPYGLRNESLSYTGLSFDPANNYHYQDKEFQTALGLNMHEFGLRHYDATLGRWGVQDPFMQFYNPYLAMGNNPVSIIDPTGGIGFSSQGNPKRATYDDPEYYRGGGGGRGIATVGGPMGWGQVGVSAWSHDWEGMSHDGTYGDTKINNDAISAYIASLTGTNQYGVGADGKSNYGYVSAWQDLIKTNAFENEEYSKFIGPDPFPILLPTVDIEDVRNNPGIIEKYAQEHYDKYNQVQTSNSNLLSESASFGTAVVGSMATMVQGSAELTQADALTKINRANSIISSEKAAFKTMGNVATGAKFLGSALGVLSLADHFSKAKSSFSNEGIYSVNGWLNVGKVGLDGTFIFIRTNPVVLTISFGYGILDASGYLDYKP